MQFPTNFNSFIRMAFATPMLEAAEEKALAIKSNNGCLQSTQTLIVSHLRLVVSVAQKYINSNLPKEDIIQEGTIGLMEAVKKYDPSSNVRLSVIATIHIKNRILEYVRKNWDIVKVVTTKNQRKVFDNISMVRKHLMDKKAVSEIAAELKVPERDILEMTNRLSAHSSSMTTIDGQLIYEDYLTDNTSTLDVLQMRDEEYQIYTLKEAVDKLGERERDIIWSRYLTENPDTLEVLALRHNISKERVRQIETATIKKLKSMVRGGYFG